MSMTDLQKLILRHEGLPMQNGRCFPYKDIVGKLTIGCGRNLTDNGISQEEAMFLFHTDVYEALETARSLVPNFELLTRPRQLVLASMAFNLGRTRLAGFQKMLAAIQKGDFSQAADEMLESRWAIQVGNRAHELAAMMRRNLSTEV